MIGRRTKPPADDDAKPMGFDDYDVRLGDLMRGERATLGKSLLDVQRELKIKAAYIAAIENADPSAFDTPGFVAGYVRSYARYLEMDPDWAFKKFSDECGFVVAHGMSSAAAGAKPATRRDAIAPSDPISGSATPFSPGQGSFLSNVDPSAYGSVAVVFALVMAMGYGGWTVFHEIQKVQFTPVDQAPGVVATLEPMSGVGQDVTVAELDVTAPEPDRLYRPKALDVPVMVARDGPISTIDPNSVGALAPSSEEGMLASRVAPELDLATDSIQVVEAAAPTVELLAVRASWVQVQDQSGTVIFEKILDAGERYEVPLDAGTAVGRIGNAGSVYFEVAGETYGPAGVGPSVVKNLELTPEGLTGTYQTADLSKDDALARFVAVAEAKAD
ncbi:MAG: DUF4115 domain-containing protein [Rhodobacteraceae bacterium]|nr:DUF4115 domain-containing protein [Paracoccaceae bacterium]